MSNPSILVKFLREDFEGDEIAVIANVLSHSEDIVEIRISMSARSTVSHFMSDHFLPDFESIVGLDCETLLDLAYESENNAELLEACQRYLEEKQQPKEAEDVKLLVDLIRAYID